MTMPPGQGARPGAQPSGIRPPVALDSPGAIPSPTEGMLRKPPTARDKVRTQLARLRPNPSHLVDAAFTLVLVGLALAGFANTFFGLGWLWVGLAGVMLGLLVTHVASTFRVPGILAAVAVALVYLLLGGPVAIREDLIIGFIPSGETFTTLVRMAVPGWKELLTALPPVDSEGPYLALPFLFGLVGAALTYGVARCWPGAVVAMVAPVGLLVVSLLLGTVEPAAEVLQGAVFGLVAIGWAALRSNRNRPALQNGAGRTTRAVTTAVLLVVATVGGFFVGPMLPGAGGTDRTVLRSSLVPPFDVGALPSPLAGFRQYTEPNAAKLYDQVLLKVEGLPPGTPVRFAALDSYDDYVWGAGNYADIGNGDQGATFRKVGSHIASTAPGTEVTAKVTVPAAGYSDVWLPTFGSVTGLEFGGSNGDRQADELRFNVDTNTGVVPSRLAPGDEYTVTARVTPPTPTLPKDVELGSDGAVETSSLTFLDERVDQWSGRADGLWPKIVAIAGAMKDGAYTDGGVAGDTLQNVFLPGHSLRRMTTFMKATQLAGNDEQYAAALALAANRLGVPARVVLGAFPDATGTIRGKDVHAWVEVLKGDGTWQEITHQQFLPDRNKKPEQLIQKSDEKKTGAQVPPPAANNPPSVLQGPDQAQNATQLGAPPKDDDNPLDPSTWPDWLRWLVFFGVLPLLVLLLVYLAIRLTKWIRRRRRRRIGVTARRVTAGWREVVDTAGDLRMPVPVTGTRIEQAKALELHVSPVRGLSTVQPFQPSRGHESGSATPSRGHESGPALDLLPLASSANGHVFDLDEPTPEDVEAFWADVATARRALRRERSFWQRVRADISLRTFRPPPVGTAKHRKQTHPGTGSAVTGTLPAPAGTEGRGIRALLRRGHQASTVSGAQAPVATSVAPMPAGPVVGRSQPASTDGQPGAAAPGATPRATPGATPRATPGGGDT